MSSTIINEVTYSYSGTSASAVACTTMSNLSVVIPSTITVASTTYNVVSIGVSAFSNKVNIVSLSLPSSLTSIGSSAFTNCSNITSAITIPAGMTTLEPSAFQGCSKIPAFLFASSNTLKSIGSNTFTYCSGATSINIPTSVTSIATTAFYNCMSLISMTIPSGVTSLESSVFNYCTNLTSVTIPEGVSIIKSSAFNSCFKLPSITIPTSVTSIQDSAFVSCSGITSAITIPANVKSIGVSAFAACTKIPSVFFADSSTLTSIGNTAFNTCTALTSINLPNSLTTMGYQVFQLSGLRTLDFPLGMTVIPSLVCYQCYYLTSATIPNSVTYITDGAFRSCNVLTSVTIPQSVTSMGSQIFSNSYSLPTINLPSGLTQITYQLFSDCASLTSVTIPKNVTYIDSGAFLRCYNLSTITIPKNVTSIGAGGFQGCSKLATAYFLNTTSTPTINNAGFYQIPSTSIAYVLSGVTYTSIVGLFSQITIIQTIDPTKKLNVFLPGFTDIQRNLGAIGTFSGDYASYTALSKYDANLYYGADLSTWQSCMKFATDGSIDVQQESVTLYFYKHPGLLGKSGLTNASSYTTSTTGMYQVNNALTVLPDKSNVVYTKNKVTDFSASIDYPDDPAAGLNFLKLLAKGVFGSIQAVDMFSNENELAVDYGLTVESCFNYCNTLLNADATGDTTTGTSNSIRFIQSVFSYMMSLTDVKARFDMTYKAVVTTGTFTTGSDIAVKLNGVATLARVDVFMDENNILRIAVRTPTNASTFAKNNVVTIEQASSGAVITITLNSVQAAMLNGKLNEPTELPLEEGDTFHINMYPRNNSNQMTAANKLLEINTANRVVQSCDVHVQMIA